MVSYSFPILFLVSFFPRIHDYLKTVGFTVLFICVTPRISFMKRLSPQRLAECGAWRIDAQ